MKRARERLAWLTPECSESDVSDMSALLDAIEARWPDDARALVGTSADDHLCFEWRWDDGVLTAMCLSHGRWWIGWKVHKVAGSAVMETNANAAKMIGCLRAGDPDSTMRVGSLAPSRAMR